MYNVKISHIWIIKCEVENRQEDILVKNIIAYLLDS